jgi:perosamine synthetase
MFPFPFGFSAESASPAAAMTDVPPRARIPLSAPLFNEADKRAVLDTLQEGWVSTAAPIVRRFEEAMGAYFEEADSVALNSGTAALHVALQAAGIGPGDEVIVPALTFVATVNPVRYLGATPVFADVDAKTLGLSVQTVLPKLTSKTKAIIATHLFGLVCEIDQLALMAQAQGIILIEDASEALGSRLYHQKVGIFGDFGCFSFNGNKTLTTGSGGLLLANNPLYPEEMLRGWTAQARVLGSEEIEHEDIGYNYRMNAMQAALGLSQLQRLEAFIAARQWIAKRYAEALNSSTDQARVLYMDPETSGQLPSYWLTCLLLQNPEKRLPLIQAANNHGIELRPFFKPIPLLAPYQAFADPHPETAYPNALQLWQTGINLPSSHWLPESDQDYVIDFIRNWLAQNA